LISVRDAGRELADRSQLPALHELLLHAALLSQVLDQREDQCDLAVVARNCVHRQVPRRRAPVGAAVDAIDARAGDKAAIQLVFVLAPPREWRPQADDLVGGPPDELAERAVDGDDLVGGGMRDADRRRDRVEERVQRLLVQLVAKVLVGDVAENDHRAGSDRGDAAAEDELAAVECLRADGELAAAAGLQHRLPG